MSILNLSAVPVEEPSLLVFDILGVSEPVLKLGTLLPEHLSFAVTIRRHAWLRSTSLALDT